MPQTPGPLPRDTASPVNHPSDTVFEVDPATRTRLNLAPVAEDPHNAILSALIDSVPDDHAPEVLLPYSSHTDKALILKQGPDLISDVVTIDDVTVTYEWRLRHITIPLSCSPRYGIAPVIHIPRCL